MLHSEFEARRRELTNPLSLGNIVYSNCFPVHARLIDHVAPGDPRLVHGVPSRLNRLLAAGEVDVAPSSSIAYAAPSARYVLFPDLVIGSHGAVRSILLLSDRPPQELDGCRVALPSASATSVVLLKILLRIRWNARPLFFDFDQSREDPFAGGAQAALFIGDAALRVGQLPDRPVRLDLGEEWWKETGLPFAFALWQARSEVDGSRLRFLRRRLVASRDFALANLADFAERYADHFGFPSLFLEHYWRGLSYHLDSRMVEGVEAFFRSAAEIGEIERVPELRWLD